MGTYVKGGLSPKGLFPGMYIRAVAVESIGPGGLMSAGSYVWGGGLRKAALVLVAYARGFMTGIYVRLLLRKKPSLR